MSALSVRPHTVFASSDDRTASAPAEARGIPRDGVRLLVATPERIQHTTFRGIGDFLRRGDMLVVNTSATVPGQLDGHWRGRPVVVHVANGLGDGTRVVELRTAPAAAAPILDASPSELVSLDPGGLVELLQPYPRWGSSPTAMGNRLWRGRVRVADGPAAYLRRHGRPISYGYLKQDYPIEAYQSVFALHAGSAEMPSAGRPFTPGLVARLVAAGVGFAPITLHTGVSSQDAGEAPQEEWFEVAATTADLVNAARRRGGRIVAVGTTATRALESAAGPDGTVSASSGWTDLVISTERPVRTVGGLVTGWHNPEASHLLLVEAVAGPDLTQQAYDEAVARGYLWHEFGDSCLLLPSAADGGLSPSR